MIHDFQKSRNRGDDAAAHLKAVFANIGHVYKHGEQWLVVAPLRPNARKLPGEQVDAIHIEGREMGVIHRVDYKLDSKATKFSWNKAVGEEGQLTLEDHHREADGQIKPGWVHASKADRIVSYVPQNEIAYCLILSRIRELWDVIQRFPLANPVRTSLAGKRTWETYNYYVSVAWLRLHGIIEREVSTALVAAIPIPMQEDPPIRTPDWPVNQYLEDYLNENPHLRGLRRQKPNV